MKQVYWTYRFRYPQEWDRRSPSYFLDKQFSEYVESGYTYTKDMLIPEERYTSYLPSGKKKQSRFIVGGYLPVMVSEEDFKKSIEKNWSLNSIYMFEDAQEAIDRIRNFTDLEEAKDEKWETIVGKFILEESVFDEITGETTKTKYLIID